MSDTAKQESAQQNTDTRGVTNSNHAHGLNDSAHACGASETPSANETAISRHTKLDRPASKLDRLARLPLEALLYYVLYGDEPLSRLTA